MAVAVLVGCWLVAIFIVYALLRRYRDPRAANKIVLLAVFLCWLFPFSITFLLPIDVSSTRYEQCAPQVLLAGQDGCAKSWMYVPASLRQTSWLVVYWSTFVLTW